MLVEIDASHEDKVINGVLCYFYEGKWVEYTKEELTSKFLLEQDALDSYITRIIEGDDFIACGGELL